MADNVTLNPGSEGAVLATDEIGGVHYQVVKLAYGGADSAVLASATSPFPVAGPLTDTQLRATAVPVSGPLTDTQLRATAVPVSGPLTDTQLRATAVPVSGPLTDVQLRASAVPVSIAQLPAALGSGGGVVVEPASQPARSRTTDTISAAMATDALMSGTTALTPKRATISAAASGDNTLVAGVEGKKIRVLAMAMFSSDTLAAFYLSNGSGGSGIFADATNKLYLDKTGISGPSGMVLSMNPLGWFETTAGNALVINLNGANPVAGCLVYVEV